MKVKVLDEKSLTILEEVDKGKKLATDLYKATRPTQYRGLNTRLQEMYKAGLLELDLKYMGARLMITDFGKKVAKLLKEAQENNHMD